MGKRRRITWMGSVAAALLGLIGVAWAATVPLSTLSSATTVASTDTLAICQLGSACTVAQALVTATMAQLKTFFLGGNTITAGTGTLTIAAGKTATDTSGTGAVLLKGATGGGFAAATAADIPATSLPSPGSGATLVAPRSYYECTTTCTVTPPTPAAGYEFCIRNADAVTTVITLAAITSVFYEKTTFAGYGTVATAATSGGAAGDKVCLLGKDSTHYDVMSFNGTWSMP